ncbi:hypothetical protein FA95DRAFT_1614269 [Auriscalpium vulgare]|uniref:Uncharacterized protein n=1 Tax=Auriscalpium vulgare TaxID=40419 RepID=A0ACB8R1G3_9AGAM|nr:hypothetical protein FA95DRAFT_1614269 [Auriscalpium vulgare]
MYSIDAAFWASHMRAWVTGASWRKEYFEDELEKQMVEMARTHVDCSPKPGERNEPQTEATHQVLVKLIVLLPGAVRGDTLPALEQFHLGIMEHYWFRSSAACIAMSSTVRAVLIKRPARTPALPAPSSPPLPP